MQILIPDAAGEQETVKERESIWAEMVFEEFIGNCLYYLQVLSQKTSIFVTE